MHCVEHKVRTDDLYDMRNIQNHKYQSVGTLEAFGSTFIEISILHLYLPRLKGNIKIYPDVEDSRSLWHKFTDKSKVL